MRSAKEDYKEFIDHLIERWHNGEGTGLQLHEFLGMSWKEYVDYFSYMKTLQNNKQEMN